MLILFNNRFALALTLGLLWSQVNVSGALKCYTCKECGSRKGNESECKAGHFNDFVPLPTKPHDPSIPEKPVCVSLTYKNKIYRGCDGLATEETKMGCTTDNGKTVCYCDTDLCNGGANPGANARFSQLLIPLLSLTTLFAYHRNNGLH